MRLTCDPGVKSTAKFKGTPEDDVIWQNHLTPKVHVDKRVPEAPEVVKIPPASLEIFQNPIPGILLPKIALWTKRDPSSCPGASSNLSWFSQVWQEEAPQILYSKSRALSYDCPESPPGYAFYLLRESHSHSP